MQQDNQNDELMHYGQKFRSGRYPYGSGKENYQHSSDFLNRVEGLKSKGLKETEIARAMGFNTSQLRNQMRLAEGEQRSIQVARARKLEAKGMTPTEIAKEMGYKNESSVRSLLDKGIEERKNEVKNTSKFLADQLKEKGGYLDVGEGVAKQLNITENKLETALYDLDMQGYEIYSIGVEQPTNPGQRTTVRLLTPPGTTKSDPYQEGALDKINTVSEFASIDRGQTYGKMEYPSSVSSKRVKVRYAEEGGIENDGLIELRRNVDDLSLGNSAYSQVRILVGKDRYLKGMAVYADDLPDGTDIRFNTNKKKGTDMRDVLKETKVNDQDPNNPFGSTIKKNGQSKYIGKDGKEHLSAINKKSDEGDWDEWSDTLPSQFLSKQNIGLIKRQIKVSTTNRQSELDEIMSVTNPTLKKQLLKDFADECDSTAISLKTAAIPRQKYQVILPVDTMRDTEVYAPNYRDGEKVALIRYPHGGTFEIPIVTVNNKNAKAMKMMGKNPLDAVGINSKVAERLSGADFDGDFVQVLPIGKGVSITSRPQLEGLKNFDAKTEYGTTKKVVNGKTKYYVGDQEVKIMSKGATGNQMGKASNLITDMQIKGANDTEMAAAVRHSMVVIDANKHKLDYRQSYYDNGIATLKNKYQAQVDPETGKVHYGTSTLISRAKGQITVRKTKGTPKIDEKTGKYIYKLDPEEYVDKKGNTRHRMVKSVKMKETDDARTLISELDTKVEREYANYANKLKAMANEARKESEIVKSIPYSKSARKTYQQQVNEIDAAINVAKTNQPKERKATILAAAKIESLKKSNPDIKNDNATLKKEKQRAMTNARAAVGAKRQPVSISDTQWEAIQAGAISKSKMEQIIRYGDTATLRKLATPRTKSSLSSAKIANINAKKNAGYTNQEIADSLGVSKSLVIDYLKVEKGDDS